MCRRWRRLVYAPRLLETLEFRIPGSGPEMVQRVGSISAWLLRRAAGRVQRLHLTSEHSFQWDFENPDVLPAMTAVMEFFAVLPALNSNLQLVDLCIDFNTQLVCSLPPSHAWAAALRSLRRLHIGAGIGGYVTVDSLRALSALEDFKIDSSVLEMPAHARLPPALQRLDLSCAGQEPPHQVCCTMPQLCAGGINPACVSAQQLRAPAWTAPRLAAAGALAWAARKLHRPTA